MDATLQQDIDEAADSEVREALALIRHHKLGPWIEAHVKSGFDAVEISNRLETQQHVKVSDLVIRRWIRESLTVTQAVRSNPLVAEYLEREGVRDQLVEEVPEDIQRLNDAADFCTRLIKGQVPDLEGSGVKVGTRIMIKLKAAEVLGRTLKTKYSDLLGEKVETKKATSAEDSVLAAAQEVYGPTARAVPEAEIVDG
jgi:hypothetical protein